VKITSVLKKTFGHAFAKIQLTRDKLKDRRLWFGTESDPDDPLNQNEDLGDNSMAASAYGIKNLKRTIAKLPEWTKQANKEYASLDELYGQIVSQYGRYMGHVAKHIGGIMNTPKMVEQAGVVVEFTPQSKTKRSLTVLHEQLFKTPKWLVDNDISDSTNDNPLTIIGTVQDNILGRLISANTFGKLLRFEAEESNAYTAAEMMADLKKGIWNELSTKQSIDIYRRNLQKVFVERLIRLATPEPVTATTVILGAGSSANNRTNDVISIAKMGLRSLQTEIRGALPMYKDATSRAHLQDVNDGITAALDPK